MTVQVGCQSGMPRTCPERSYASFEQFSHREAPNEGFRPHAVQIHLARLSAYRRRAAAFFFGWRRASITAQGPQTGAPSNVGVAHLVQRPAARRAEYVCRSEILRDSRQVPQLEPPSTGQPVPHRMHRPAVRRAPCRFRLRLLAWRRRVTGFLPPWVSPAALAQAYRSRSRGRARSPQVAHRRRSGSRGSRPHLPQSPFATRSSARFLARRYSSLRACGSRTRRMLASRRLAARARAAARLFSPHCAHSCRPASGGWRPHRKHNPSSRCLAVRRRARSRSFSRLVFRIAVRHGERLLYGRMNEDGGPAGAGARPGGDGRSAALPTFTPQAARGVTPVLNA